MTAKPGLTRLSSGLLVPAQADTVATPRKKRDETTQPSQPESRIEDGVARSKQQAIKDLPERLDLTTVRVIMGSGYSFHLNRRTNTLQVYSENHAARRQRRLQEKRAAKKAKKNGATDS